MAIPTMRWVRVYNELIGRHENPLEYSLLRNDKKASTPDQREFKDCILHIPCNCNKSFIRFRNSDFV